MSMTEIEQDKLFKKFKKVVDTRDSQKIDKALYNHLYLRTGFIAHYDIHGFRATYSGRGFLTSLTTLKSVSMPATDPLPNSIPA
jgi:hypothetical protein